MKSINVNVTYYAPEGIDSTVEKEIMTVAETYGGEEGGGSGFMFGSNERDFDIDFPDTASAERFLKEAIKKFKKYKVKGSIV